MLFPSWITEEAWQLFQRKLEPPNRQIKWIPWCLRLKDKMPENLTMEKGKTRNIILPTQTGEAVEESFILVKGRAFPCLLSHRTCVWTPNSEPPELTKFYLEMTLAMRNLACITWYFTTWEPTPAWESTSNTVGSFNSCGTFPKMPWFQPGHHQWRPLNLGVCFLHLAHASL